jgi:glycosyltransferase involved in cell wall biosynthesis
LKILNISTYDTGGAGLAAIRHHELLLKNGYQSSILFLEYKKYKGENVHVINRNEFKYEEPTLTLKNYFLERFFSYFTKKRNEYFNSVNKDLAFTTKIASDSLTKFECFSSPKTSFDIINHPAYVDADIIHFHFVSGFLDYESFFKSNTKPVYWSLHDENFILGAFHFKLDSDNNIEEYGSIDQEYYELKVKAINNRKCQLTLLSGSNWMINKLNLSSDFKEIDVKRFFYPINKSLYHYVHKKNAKEMLNLPMDKKIFLFTAGNINNKRKGFDILSPIFNDSNFENALFLIMGNSPDLIKSKNVIQLGSITDEILMPIIYGAADYYILPSRAEGFSLAMSESLCCGTPVIAFDVADHKEFLEGNNLGIVIPEISTEGLKKCLINVLNNQYTFDNSKLSSCALSYLDSEVSFTNLVNCYNLK